MLVEIDANGMINHARVKSARSPEIERGRRTGAITGIVVHQTDADTSASSLNSYKRPKANGAQTWRPSELNWSAGQGCR